MATFLRLKCTLCKRSIDKLENNFRYTPDKCTITLGCDGRLQAVSEHNNPSIAVKPVAGVTDWYARSLVKDFSTQKTIYPISEPVKTFDLNGVGDSMWINAVTGQESQLVMAVKGVTPGYIFPNTIDVCFEIAKDKPKAFTSYLFGINAGEKKKSISGREDGGKILRYSITGPTPDTVEVRVNGVPRKEGDGENDYKLVPATNSVEFNSFLPSDTRTQVNVIVTKAVAPTTTTITFHKTVGSSNTAGGAYENVKTVTRMDDGIPTPYAVYSVNVDTSGIPVNSLIAPVKVQTLSESVDFSKAFFMLAREPYLIIDRYTNGVIPFVNLDVDKSLSLKVYTNTETGKKVASVSTDALAVVFPPLIFSFYKEEKPYNLYSAGVSDQVTFDGGIIVGPDK